jgi:hypothetical protein
MRPNEVLLESHIFVNSFHGEALYNNPRLVPRHPKKAFSSPLSDLTIP